MSKEFERVCYVHNIDTFNAMLKESKIMLSIQYRYIQCYVERVKRLCYVHNIDVFNAMSKGSKEYVMHII